MNGKPAYPYIFGPKYYGYTISSNGAIKPTENLALFYQYSDSTLTPTVVSVPPVLSSASESSLSTIIQGIIILMINLKSF